MLLMMMMMMIINYYNNNDNRHVYSPKEGMESTKANKKEEHSRMINIQVFPSLSDGRKLFIHNTRCIRQSTEGESYKY